MLFIASNLFAKENVLILGLKTKRSLENLPVNTIIITQEEIEKYNAKSIGEILGNYAGIRMIKPQ